jgi:uncharacterized protein (TIGR02231 family)
MTELKTIVSEVTLFVQGARITRKGKTEVETGIHHVKIPNLPLSLEAESLRVRASGTARARILGVDVQKAFYEKAPPGKVRELTDQIEKLEDEDRVLADEADSLGEAIKQIDRMAGHARAFAVSLARGKASLDDQADRIDFFLTKRMEAQNRLRDNEIKRRDLGRDRKKLRKELKELQNSRPDEGFSALVELEIEKAGDLDVELVYTIRGAGWEPLYDIRLEDSKLEIDYLGQVTQSSGEDWSDVALSLSTVTPSAGIQVPELDPWYLSPVSHFHGRAVPVAAAAAAGPPGDEVLDETMMMAETELVEEPMAEVSEAEYATAHVVQSGLSITYVIPGRAHIPDDGSPHKVTIDRLGFSPTIDYVIAPRIQASAFRRVKAENESPLMLLPGAAQIFEGKDFMGKSRLKMIAPGETIKLYYGTDDRIRVERKLVKRETDKKILKDKRRIRFAYEIKLENHTGADQAVVIRDQIPVSKHENIKVALENEKPASTKRDELNRMKWKMVLPEKDRQRIRYDFSVEYPRDMEITGLP